MRSMHLLLDEAEGKWRDEVRQDFPLYATMPVIKRTSQNGRDWSFSTDLRQIYAEINGDGSLQKKFESVVSKYWEGNPEELAGEVLHYLLFHELYHPVEAPRSMDGDENDNKRIHQSIRRGVIAAEPKLSALDQVQKVQASQNMVKDFILDNRFYLDNKRQGYTREDVIPIWDFLELQSTPSKENAYTITRFLYGLLYGPEKTHEFFEGKTGAKGVQVAEAAMSALLSKSVRFGKDRGLVEKLKTTIGLATEKSPSTMYIRELVDSVRTVFAGDDRYKGIERFMKILGPYVEKSTPQGRTDIQGEGSGCSPQNILEDLLDDMSPQEQESFVNELAQEKPELLETAADQMSAGKRPSSPSSVDQMKNLDLLATHEFYKRNHPRVKILGGKKVGESVVVGNEEKLVLARTEVITEDQLRKINLREIGELQRKTRLPWLLPIGKGVYRLNEYEVNNRPITDVVYRELDLDVPDKVDFYVDSSGSMFHSSGEAIFRPNDGSSWDMLSNVMYGFVDALRQAGSKVGKRTQIQIHNFAEKQVESNTLTADQFWNGDLEALRVFFKPENGYGHEDINIAMQNDAKNRACVVVTDGNLVLEGRTEREARKMKKLAQNPNTSVMLFEIGGTYSLGRAVKNDPAINYYPVHDKKDMFEHGLEVLLSK